MNNGYGQIFLLLAAIGLILLGASGKAKELWDVLKGGSTPTTPNNNANQKSTNPTQVPDISKNGNAGDKAGSGSGGLLG
jgi:hypothetical protein